jgi:hypothetical protein
MSHGVIYISSLYDAALNSEIHIKILDKHNNLKEGLKIYGV